MTNLKGIVLEGTVTALFILLCTGTFSFVAGQQGVLKGHIYDHSSGEPLAYANIVKDGTSTGTYSNAYGAYKLTLPAGEQEVRYKFLSYRDTVVTVEIKEGEETVKDIYLRPESILMDDVVVSADRVVNKVEELARLRDRQQRGLESYEAEVYKLAILSSVEEGFSYSDSAQNDLDPMAYSERLTRIQYIETPRRYTEKLLANRSSKNFFSEYDFFSTGGSPLNLNQDEVPLSILSEDITVVGPISDEAGRFYELNDEEAGDNWPEETVKITVTPKVKNKPLFRGEVWYNENTSRILGIDVELNDYASTNSGLFKITDLRYQQSYKKVDKFWLPEKTELSALLSFVGSDEQILYKDEWTWTDHRVNVEGLEVEDMELNTSIILPNAHSKSKKYWDTLSVKTQNQNLKYLDEAKSYREKRTSVKLGMSVMRSFFRLPYQLERFYLTNISDIYHFNRVEGHYLGLGVRTPVHPDYDYRLIAGYGFGNERYSYKLKAHHYIPGTPIAPEVTYRKETLQQYQDYVYNRTPIDFFESRQTMNALVFGDADNNYFEREGIEAGLRFRFDVESFIRLLYVNEEQHLLTSSTSYNLFDSDIEPAMFANNHPVYPAQTGAVNGFNIHFHYDTRQYLRTQFLRDYNIRKFGWLSDFWYEKGMENWGSDFDYNRYRLGLKFNWPVFTSHFIQTDFIFGAADSGVPNQRLFSYNGFVVDDYVRERPFNTVSYKFPIGRRVSEIRVKYKFGTSITRKSPVEFIQKSGIHLAAFLTFGVIDDEASLVPLVPHSGSEAQAELGIAAFKVLGFMYIEFSKRLAGSYGDSIGLKVLF